MTTNIFSGPRSESHPGFAASEMSLKNIFVDIKNKFSEIVNTEMIKICHILPLPKELEYQKASSKLQQNYFKITAIIKNVNL